jgi:acetyltransferase-like isoleucine patch superfamily enzyme
MSEKVLDRDIFERDMSGEPVSIDDPEYPKLKEVMLHAAELTARLNTSVHSEDEIRNLFSELTGSEVDESTRVTPPFYTDFGRNIKVGKNVFINHGCTFMDRGDITIEDETKIGPKVNLITSNHPLDRPIERN